MTSAEILARFRELADDNAASNNLWSDATLLAYLNEAQNEAARRARLLEDRDTSAVCSIAVVAGTSTYAVDSRVLFIRRVKASWSDVPLVKARAQDLDTHEPGWEAAAAVAEPRWWQPWPGQKIRIEKPSANGTLSLWVVRDPLQDCTVSGTPVNPEIPARYHFKLVDWMLYRALLQRDKEEKYDPKSAADHLALFEQEFGPRSSAIDETWIQRQHGYDDHEGLY